MKKIITMIVLLLALAASVFSAYTLGSRTAALEKENQARVEAAQQELDTIKAEYAAIDPSTDEGMKRQIEAENQAIAEALKKAEALAGENESLRKENEALTQDVSALEANEDNAYYLTVYEHMQKGMELVEGYLDGE